MVGDIALTSDEFEKLVLQKYKDTIGNLQLTCVGLNIDNEPFKEWNYVWLSQQLPLIPPVRNADVPVVAGDIATEFIQGFGTVAYLPFRNIKLKNFADGNRTIKSIFLFAPGIYGIMWVKLALPIELEPNAIYNCTLKLYANQWTGDFPF